jgi:hypothetical protein
LVASQQQEASVAIRSDFNQLVSLPHVCSLLDLEREGAEETLRSWGLSPTAYSAGSGSPLYEIRQVHQLVTRWHSEASACGPTNDGRDEEDYDEEQDFEEDEDEFDEDDLDEDERDEDELDADELDGPCSNPRFY